MKKILLSSVVVLAALTASAQAYTGKPYTGTAIGFPNTLTNPSQLVGVIDGADVTKAWAFDKKGDLAAFATDEGVTCFKNPATTLTTALTASYVRNCQERTDLAQVNNSYKWNGVPDAFENAQAAKFYFTVNFTKAGSYYFYLCTRGGVGNKYSISVLDKTNMATVVADLSLSSAGLSVSSPIGTASTDATCEMVGIAKTSDLTSGQKNSIWIERTAPITIATPGEYVLSVSQTAGGTGASFAGFTFIEQTATSISETANDASLSFDGKIIQATVLGTATLVVFDLSGRQVATYSVNGSINQNLGLKAGIYIVALSGAGVNKTMKVVVK